VTIARRNRATATALLASLCFLSSVAGCGRTTVEPPVSDAAPDGAVFDAPSEEVAFDAPPDETSSRPDAGGQGAPCRVGADCAEYYQCIVQAAVASCPSTPIGFCSYAPPSNCIVSSDRCACFQNGPVQPDCSSFPNTVCDVVVGDDGGRCATCVPATTSP
jgi:hypothetical protein